MQNDYLSPEIKKLVAKVMQELGWSTRQVAGVLGMDDVTVWRCKQSHTKEGLKQSEADIRILFTYELQNGLALIMGRIRELIPKERRISELVKAGDFYSTIIKEKGLSDLASLPVPILSTVMNTAKEKDESAIH